MRKFPKALAGIGVGAVLAVGTFASAQFVLQGQGDATGKVATPNQPTVTGTIQGDLWPGYCNDVSLTFSNTNADHAVKIINAYGLPDSQQSQLDTHLLAANPNAGGNPGTGGVSITDESGADITSNPVVAGGKSATIVIKKAVCLSPSADDQQWNRDTAFLVNVASNVVVGTDYNG